MSRRIADYSMYTLPGLEGVIDDLWRRLGRAFQAEGIRDVPRRLTRGKPVQMLWRDPALLFTQTCGYPMMTAFRHHLQPIATPCYAVEGCEGPTYRSAIIVREDEPVWRPDGLAGKIAAINSTHSQSGYNALRAYLAPYAKDGRLLGSVLTTGKHGLSIKAVREGRADVAAIDPVTWALHRRYAPEAIAGIRIMDWSAPCPGLPFATSQRTTVDTLRRLRAGLDAVFNDPEAASTLGALMLTGVAHLSTADYAPILEMEANTVAQGYPTLA